MIAGGGLIAVFRPHPGPLVLAGRLSAISRKSRRDPNRRQSETLLAFELVFASGGARRCDEIARDLFTPGSPRYHDMDILGQVPGRLYSNKASLPDPTAVLQSRSNNKHQMGSFRPGSSEPRM
jgi:hypothetical protein